MTRQELVNACAAAIAIPVLLLTLRSLAPPCDRCFQGDWNDVRALQTIYGNFDSKTHAAYNGTSCVAALHTMPVTVAGMRQQHMFTYEYPAGPDCHPWKTCHSCGVDISGTVFQQHGKWWVYQASDLSVMEAGGWGGPPRFEPVDWGKEAVGLLLHSGSTWMGVTAVQTSFFARHNGRFQSFFTVETLYDTAGAVPMIPAEHRESTVTFTEAGPHDVRKLSIDGGIYIFDGNQYVSETSGSALH